MFNRTVHERRNIFCSRFCLGKNYIETMKGEKNPHWRGGEIKINCAFCKKEYFVVQARIKISKYCGRICRNKAYTGKKKLNPIGNKNKIQRSCIKCSKIFYVFPSRLKERGAGQFCNKICANLAKIKIIKTRTDLAKIKILKTISGQFCIDCKKQFSYRILKNKEYKKRCLECWKNFSRGSNHPAWKGGRICIKCGIFIGSRQICRKYCKNCRTGKAIFIKCYFCGKILKRYKHNLKKISHCIACRSLMSHFFNSNYKGGIKSLACLIRNSKKNKDLIKYILKRDNFICKWCGQKGGKLQMDHKINFSILFKKFLQDNSHLNLITDKEQLYQLAMKHQPFWDENNLQTLCKFCNIKKYLMKTKIFMKEKVVVKKIRDYIKSLNGISYKTTGGVYCERGASDLMICLNGHTICCEVKLPGNKPTPVQVQWMNQWQKIGALCIVAHSLEEFKQELLKSNFLKETQNCAFFKRD